MRDVEAVAIRRRSRRRRQSPCSQFSVTQDEGKFSLLPLSLSDSVLSPITDTCNEDISR